MAQSLTYDEIIQFAIDNEKNANALYSNLARKTENSAGKVFFEELADMEKSHQKKLEMLDKNYFSSSKIEPPQDLKISDYLVDVEIKPDSSYQDILLFAAKSEKAAFELYSDFAKMYSNSPEIKKMFEVLAQEEAAHKLKLEREYDDNVYTED